MKILKRRLGRDKQSIQKLNAGESTQAGSQPPPISNPIISTAGDGSQTIRPSTNTVSQPTNPEQLPLSHIALDPRSTISIPQRSRSIDRRKDPVGLTIVYNPETLPSLDIIFVHAWVVLVGPHGQKDKI